MNPRKWPVSRATGLLVWKEHDRDFAGFAQSKGLSVECAHVQIAALLADITKTETKQTESCRR
jgi:hypothetical protein